MTASNPKLTPPIFVTNSAVLFSAYEFGWGYCSFALDPDAVCEALGAADTTQKQLLLAFELNKRRLLEAVEKKAIHGTGERIILSATDL
ncbi:hypothetical protein [Paraburkholderia lacunae]|uniref:hypothetical protein n=1 Tax=Paraburkholderia lacunae TaxID=2211104 RepID=UPI00140405ED|nr:hypothetical protein [Paraburkholderia lacunae]